MIATNAQFDAAALQKPMVPVYLFSIDGYYRTFVYRPTGRVNEYAWISDIADWGLAVDDINGSYTIDNLVVTVIDSQAGVTGDLHLVTLETRRCTLKIGFEGMDLANYVTVFTGIVASIDTKGDGTYAFTLNDFNRLNQRIIYLTGDDGKAVGSAHLRRVTAHPLDILLNILIYEIGFATTDINMAQVQAYRDQVFTGIEFDFDISTAPDAKDFIEKQLLLPLGGYNFPDEQGRLTVGFAQPLAGTVVSQLSLDPTNIAVVPDVSEATLYNVVTHRFDKDESGNYMAESNTLFTAVIDAADLTGELAQAAASGTADAFQGRLIIESDGMRSGFQGFLIASMVSSAIFAKYGSFNPTLSVDCFLPAFRLFPGEFVTLSHPLIPNKITGQMGVSNVLYQVKKRQIHFASMTVTLELTDATQIKAFGIHQIAPTGEGNYTAVSAGDRAQYIFMTGTANTYSNADPGIGLG